MLEMIYFVIFTVSLVEFSQAIISCNETNVAETQLCLVNENNLDIQAYADATEVGVPLEIETALTLISIAEVCLPKLIQFLSNVCPELLTDSNKNVRPL